MRFAGKVVWITGASDGIGAALARALSAEGARLVLTARNRDKLQAVAEACTEAAVIPADLANEADFEALAQRAIQAFGHLDALVNNAGVGQRGTALDTALPVVREIMEINFFAPVALTQAVVPHFIERGSGRVAVTSSLAGFIGTPARSTYAASKHAVQGWFESLRAELHGTGVGVTVFVPGYIRTDISLKAKRSDGSSYGRMAAGNAGGISADDCAARMVDALAAGRDEVVIAGREKYGVLLKRLAPGLVRRYLHRAVPEAEEGP